MAYLTALLHVGATIAILLLLQPGLALEGSSAESRRAYILGHPVAWSVGWLVWHASAISLLGLYVGLSELWRGQAPVRCGLALLCAAAGLAADLTAQAIYIGVVPRQDAAGFALAEQLAAFVTAYLGNGLYTVAGILLTWAGAAVLPRLVLVSSGVVWIAGIGLSGTTLLNSPDGQVLSTALLVPAVVVWGMLLGRWLAVQRG